MGHGGGIQAEAANGIYKSFALLYPKGSFRAAAPVQGKVRGGKKAQTIGFEKKLCKVRNPRGDVF